MTTPATRAAGWTDGPLDGKPAGLYGVMLPLAYVATVTPLGVVALSLAPLAETAVPAAVASCRFDSGAWLPRGEAAGPAPVD